MDLGDPVVLIGLVVVGVLLVALNRRTEGAYSSMAKGFLQRPLEIIIVLAIGLLLMSLIYGG